MAEGGGNGGTSPERGEKRAPATELDGGEVDEVDLGRANPTTAVARCGGGPSGG
uniref:DUF834 domain-containing protein n=1 Tax=Oryza meridionalis TaxID=40149 RepID=A0A1V1H1M8_9ORYZ|nr:hypothetical protein [Oryza meridionalis]BAX24864.1 hypothetical protein [Oryza meridionalis]